jgi:hypothetical protein
MMTPALTHSEIWGSASDSADDSDDSADGRYSTPFAIVSLGCLLADLEANLMPSAMEPYWQQRRLGWVRGLSQVWSRARRVRLPSLSLRYSKGACTRFVVAC